MMNRITVVLLLLCGINCLSEQYSFNVSEIMICKYNSKNKKYDLDCVTDKIKNSESLSIEVNDSILKWGIREYHIIDAKVTTNSDGDTIAYYITKVYDEKTENLIYPTIIFADDYINFVVPDSHKTTFILVNGTNYYSGSGFAVSEEYLVTNYHVVKSMNTIIIKGTNDSVMSGEIKFVDIDLDLAILKSNKKLKACVIHDGVYDVGADIFAFGYPRIQDQGLSIKATKGIISSKFGFRDEVKHYQIDAAIQKGNSGGPLTKDNKVVGIVVSILTDGQNVNYAIKSPYLIAMLKSTGIKPIGKSKPIECTYLLLGSDE
jgi:hypothetical protein